MLFFQLLLFGGYLYAHILRTFLPIRGQALLHVALLAIACCVLPISPSDDWKPLGDSSPTIHLLMLLAVHVGLPYFLLSSTGPLIQSWYSASCPSDRVYRLYALSNVGSLLALLSYPFVVEPLWSVTTQSVAWSWMFAGFVALQAIVAINVWRVRAARNPIAIETKSVYAQGQTIIKSTRPIGWMALAALASTLLLTTTNHICQDVAVMPFLWIMPLSLYLISFIIAFDSPKYYHPKTYAGMALVSLALMQVSSRLPSGGHLVIEAFAALAFMLFICLLCHGEAARLKPPIALLTRYYLFLSAGGAVGGIVVAILCPLVFNQYTEQSIAIALSGSLAVVLFFAARNWTGQIYNWKAVRELRFAAAILPLLSVGAATTYTTPGVIQSERNFFGVVRVESSGGDLCMVHGSTIHGVQRRAPNAAEPTTYYGGESGVGRVIAAMNSSDNREKPLRLCGVGLGCGVLATYGRPGDKYEFIEINPAVIRMAKTHFAFLSRSPATIDTHLGDGRIVLERMEHHQFDLLVLDAFSSDAIPAHLLTREAFTLYRERLFDDAMMAIHVSNKHLDLVSLVQRQAQEAGWTSKLVMSPGSHDDRTLPALWMIVAAENHPAWSHERLRFAARAVETPASEAPVWTDQQHNLLSVLRVD